LTLTPQADRLLARDGQWSYALPLTQYQDSVSHTAAIYGVDAAGNRATVGVQRNFSVDNVAPTLTVTQLIATAPLTHSLAVLRAVATDGGGVSQMYVVVEAPNETYSTLATRDGNEWRFDLQPGVIGTYTLYVSAYDRAANVSMAGPFQVEITAPQTYRSYLPSVAQTYTPGPDLVVNRLIVANNSVQVVIKNQGNQPITNEFWVDVYVKPRTAPTGVNQTWPMLGDQGLVWGVTADVLPQLVPGGVLTLTVNDAHFWPTLSHVVWPLAIDTPMYAQVDSANAGSAFGAVLEIDEMSGASYPYNNIFGPLLVGVENPGPLALPASAVTGRAPAAVRP
jgi:hypothetical protein